MKTVREGSLAPDFELPDQDGKPVRLSGLLLERPVVLFFYPAALTPGCTKESCHFRDLAAEVRAAGVQMVGISTDTVDKQRRFADQNGFDYPLLSDHSGEVAVSFGVLRRFVTLAKRVTFVIDTDRVIRKVVSSEVQMNAHADRALAALARL
jgi:peroxiredoxin Q/BCP